jgi:diadenosine tetraphosphate (Ap4A) HIT family hydrolase
MSNFLPKPNKKAMIFQDDKLYVCLASHPITSGHTVVVWKEDVADLHLLNVGEYEYLMYIVDAVRDALLKTLNIIKVYLVYMDEARHVHWHLVPRYNEKGYDVFDHEPKILKDFSLAKKIKKNLVFK